MIGLGKAVDMTGIRYGRLVAIKEVKERLHGHKQWLCKCDCGKVVLKRGVDVRNGKTVSCGCYQKEGISKRAKGIAPKDRKKVAEAVRTKWVTDTVLDDYDCLIVRLENQGE